MAPPSSDALDSKAQPVALHPAIHEFNLFIGRPACTRCHSVCTACPAQAGRRQKADEGLAGVGGMEEGGEGQGNVGVTAKGVWGTMKML